jgi:hypothetical protein
MFLQKGITVRQERISEILMKLTQGVIVRIYLRDGNNHPNQVLPCTSGLGKTMFH